MIKTPKVLPWIARKAGISDERVEAMWREAVCHAALQIDWNPDYYRAVMERLQELVEQEKVAALAGQLPSYAPLHHGPPDEDAARDPVLFLVIMPLPSR